MHSDLIRAALAWTTLAACLVLVVVSTTRLRGEDQETAAGVGPH